jgi:hypothetical protein
MTVDHIVRFLIPESWDADWASSSIGRIAFPLFSAMVAWHGLFNTHDAIGYTRRILIIGIVAQLPYMFLSRESFQLNICFTLALGLCWGTWLLALAHHCDRNFLKKLLAFTASLFGWYYIGPWVEYGHTGLLMIPIYMVALHILNRKSDKLIDHLAAAFVPLPLLINAGLLNSTDMARLFTVMTCLIVLLIGAGVAEKVPRISWRMPRLIWLTWYPAHLTIIVILLHWQKS